MFYGNFRLLVPVNQYNMRDAPCRMWFRPQWMHKIRCNLADAMDGADRLAGGYG